MILTGKEYVCVLRLHDALASETKLAQVKTPILILATSCVWQLGNKLKCFGNSSLFAFEMQCVHKLV